MIRVGIIGGGFYGLFIASYLTRKGYYVRVLDTNQPKASEVCQARLHNGMFYSRSLSDLKCCINNGATFYKWYRDFIIKDFNSYYLVDKNSNVSFDSFKKLAKENKLRVKPCKLDYVNTANIQGIFKAKEYSINIQGLLDHLLNTLNESPEYAQVYKLKNLSTGIDVCSDHGTYHFDKVIVCAYGGINPILNSSGYELLDMKAIKQHIYYFEDNLPNDVHAVVDGSYWNTMIHREPRKDITKSLIATNVYYDNSVIEIEWDRVLQLVHHYIPEVNMYYRDRKEFTKFLSTNTRQALFTQVDKNIYTVFAGKLPNVFSILKDLDNI